MELNETKHKREFILTLNEDEAFDLGRASYEAELVIRGTASGNTGSKFFHLLPADIVNEIADYPQGRR